MRRSPLVLALVATLAVLACRFAVHPPEVLTLAVRADVTGFFPNPPFSDESYTLYINKSVYEGLVSFDRNHSPIPAVAERWENPDETTWIFTLRQGLKFSTGEPVTPADVAASLMSPRERGWFNAGDVNAIESVTPMGPGTVRIKTKGPYPALLDKLPWGFILPARALALTPVPTVGTGPYRLEQWVPGKEFRFVRNEAFRGPPAPFERVHAIVVPDGAARMRMLETGEADLADNVPLAEIERLKRNDSIRLVSGPSGRVLFLALRMNEPPFSDPRVREAVDLAIDRGELISRALQGHALPASQLVSPAVAGYNPSIVFAKPDREKARALLKQAGHPNGLTIRLDGTNNRYVNDVEILAEVARQLALVGIRVEVNAQDKNEFYTLLTKQKSRFYLFGWACELGDAGEAFDEAIHTPTAGMLGASNYQGLSDPELDRLIDESNGTALSARRIEVLSRALWRVAELRPVIPLVIQVETFALSRRVQWDPPLNMALEIPEIGPPGRKP